MYIRHFLKPLSCWLLLLLLTGACSAAPVMPIGEPVLDPPTLRCLGVYWILQDEESAAAKVEVAYRKVGEAGWKPGPNLFRAERGPFKDEGGMPKPLAVTLPAGAHLYAGSVFLLNPDTAYQLRLTLHQGGNAVVQKTLSAHTIGEPVTPAGYERTACRAGEWRRNGNEIRSVSWIAGGEFCRPTGRLAAASCGKVRRAHCDSL